MGCRGQSVTVSTADWAHGFGVKRHDDRRWATCGVGIAWQDDAHAGCGDRNASVRIANWVHGLDVKRCDKRRWATRRVGVAGRDDARVVRGNRSVGVRTADGVHGGVRVKHCDGQLVVSGSDDKTVRV